MEFLISVIVPVYNAEKYLSHCIESILNQTYKNIEVILVDDGSTDTSLKICMDYARKDNRIVVIKAQHQGVVITRRTGVENSNGEYCIFVDSDDWIAENLLETVVPLTDNGSMDMVNYSMRSYSESGYFDWEYTITPGVYENELLEIIYAKMMYDFEYGRPGIIQSLCTKLIRMKILRNCIQNVDHRITMGEDAAVVYSVLLASERITITDKCLYFYRGHAGSMCNMKDVSIFQQTKYFQEYMKQIFNGYDPKYEMNRQLQSYLMKFIEKGLKDIFGLRFQNPYRVPFDKVKDMGNKIILYGAGTVGRSYYRQFVEMKNIKIVAWLDRKPGQVYGYQIRTPDVIGELSFDKILIAVADKKKAEEIREQLNDYVSQKYVIWTEPKRNFLELELDI